MTDERSIWYKLRRVWAKEGGVAETSDEFSALVRELDAVAVGGLTRDERAAMNHLVEFWSIFSGLDGAHPTERDEAMRAVHGLQGLLACRAIRRLFPDYWWREKRT